ncbi:class 1 fructose-bisphosphatase [Haoranjiania flava]|uniref:Fructose-1,6-bisphosphatase class 1 n=1 Tax=Haoranjiania flava TaxID=1856322 RepID=A0AAE3LP26_9BACT|nr:class 1 fructose-bisphosphatase [Haoranjiania flava]MCU7695576.1 class 1 fructose-bisphosphatase [Haoranjiania flava]
MITLDEFTIQQLRLYPHATGELSGLLRAVGLAGKLINAKVRKAGLIDILGRQGSINVQGESVQKLDVIANEIFMKVLRSSINCAGMVSEENEDVLIFDDQLSNASKYVILIDPLDGSGNISVNMDIGTVFSIVKRITAKGTCSQTKDFLQDGKKQIAAGYIIYGSSTMLVYATRRGVYGFTLDVETGEFYMSHPSIKIPDTGKNFCFDYRYYYAIDDRVKKFVDDAFKTRKGTNADLSLRYSGCMVADIHRNLMEGGIFLYPGRKDKPDGKLRLMYECNPMAFITEVAGGAATDGHNRILDIHPKDFHQRTPLFIGSKSMMIQ